MQGEPLYVSVAKKLTRSSLKNSFDTFNRVQYQTELNKDLFQFPEEYVSLYHHPVYQTLTDEQKWKLSLAEAVNFFSVNIFGEQHLIKHLEDKLYRNRYIGEDRYSSHYLQHFIHEENAHTFMLAEYCMNYYGTVMSSPTIRMDDPELSQYGEDLLFYGRTFVLEMFLGYMNRIGRVHDDLDRTVKEVHHFHLLDEVRHMAWDRTMIEANLEEMRKRELNDEMNVIRRLLRVYLDVSFSSLYNPRIYREIGIKNGARLSRELADNDDRNLLLNNWKQGIFDYFKKIDFEI
jgi:hypothetical protein